MKDGEDMLAKVGWYYAVHCVQVVTKLMVFTECWW